MTNDNHEMTKPLFLVINEPAVVHSRAHRLQVNRLRQLERAAFQRMINNWPLYKHSSAPMRLPRPFVLGLAAVLLSGCKDLSRRTVWRDDYLQSWFQRRVTPEEARHYFLQTTEQLIKRLPPGRRTEKEQEELDMLRKEYASIHSHMQPLFDELIPGDELWIYRTYADGQRGGESGLALLRAGHVARRLLMIIHD
jgi:hypothetical protein